MDWVEPLRCRACAVEAQGDTQRQSERYEFDDWSAVEERM